MLDVARTHVGCNRKILNDDVGGESNTILVVTFLDQHYALHPSENHIKTVRSEEVESQHAVESTAGKDFPTIIFVSEIRNQMLCCVDSTHVRRLLC